MGGKKESKRKKGEREKKKVKNKKVNERNVLFMMFREKNLMDYNGVREGNLRRVMKIERS